MSDRLAAWIVDHTRRHQILSLTWDEQRDALAEAILRWRVDGRVGGLHMAPLPSTSLAPDVPALVCTITPHRRTPGMYRTRIAHGAAAPAPWARLRSVSILYDPDGYAYTWWWRDAHDDAQGITDVAAWFVDELAARVSTPPAEFVAYAAFDALDARAVHYRDPIWARAPMLRAALSASADAAADESAVGPAPASQPARS